MADLYEVIFEGVSPEKLMVLLDEHSEWVPLGFWLVGESDRWSPRDVVPADQIAAALGSIKGVLVSALAEPPAPLDTATVRRPIMQVRSAEDRCIVEVNFEDQSADEGEWGRFVQALHAWAAALGAHLEASRVYGGLEPAEDHETRIFTRTGSVSGTPLHPIASAG